MTYSRFAIYYLPRPGPLSDFGAAWLGWDVQKGCDTRQPDLPGLDDVTMTPRKYGFHGTLKPPFRLAEGVPVEALQAAASTMAMSLAPAVCDGLDLKRIGGFLALTPRGDTSGVQDVADACVRALDEFRAAPTEAELARRRRSRLSGRQEALLTRWGYPYVMEEFRFHMTLTGRLKGDKAETWAASLRALMPSLPAPFVMDQVALCGEREDGRFELVHRYTLAG